MNENSLTKLPSNTLIYHRAAVFLFRSQLIPPLNQSNWILGKHKSIRQKASPTLKTIT